MESSAGEWFDSDESEFQMRTALRNSTVLSPRARLVLETLMVLMSLAAVTGNFLVIVIVAATKTFHTVTSVLIINLAISDFLVGIGVMPFVAVSIMNNGWVNYNDLCLYVGYTSSVYCTASVLTLAAIALDRYFSIVDCLRYGSRCTIRRTGSVVIWIWLQAMLTSCPPLLGWSNISFVAPMYSCAVNWAKSPSYTVIMASLSFLLPAIVILFCYVKIVRVARYHARKIHSLEEHLQRNRATSVLNLQHSFMDTYTPSRLIYYVSGRFVTDQLDVPDEVAPDAPSEMSSKPTGGRLHSFMAQIHTSSPQHPSQPQHHGVLRLFLVIAAFFLCWTPYISVALVQATETALSLPRSVVPPSAVTFSYWLVLFNSDINPLLYALLSKRFQGAFQSLRWKIQARLGCVVEKVGAERSTGGGESDPTNRSTHTSTAHSRNDGESTYSSVFALSSQFPNSLREQLNNVLPLATCSRPVCHECGGRGSRAVDHLQVPSKQRERNRLPYSAATKKKQATFFYGQITFVIGPLMDVLAESALYHRAPQQNIRDCPELGVKLQIFMVNFFSSLPEENREDVVAVALKTHMLSVGDSVQEFLLRRLSGELRDNPSVPGQVQRAVGMATLALLCDVADRGVLKSQSEAMRSLYSLTDYFYPSSSSSSQHLNQTLLKPTTATVSHPEDGLLLKDWGRIVAQFIGDQWTCLSFLQKSAGTVRAPEAPEVLRAAVDALALLPGHLVLPVLDFMASVLPQQMVQCEESLCVEAVCASWKVVQALSTNPHDFWSTLQGFVRLAFDHGLLQLTEEQNPSITACIQQILSELMELAQVRSGVFNVLIQHCCETWLPAEGVQSDAVFSTALLHLNILTEACVYGPVFRRDQRSI
ncbi:unnamed protein product [Leuciscus chuanchicus]